MLSVERLDAGYGGSQILWSVDLTVPTGQVVCLMGRNGVGKTTLCRSLVGLTPGRAGRIVLDRTDITRLPPHRIHGLGVSLVPQGRRIFPSLTVRENLAIAARGDLDRVFSIFPRLAERGGHRGNELSGGEQQMLAIARALVARPRLLVLDEPTEGLAPVLVAEVAAVIRRLREEGTSILLVEQNAAFAVKVADWAHVMSRGKIVHSTDPAALWNNEEVKTQLLGVPPAGTGPEPRREL
jgi:branched-chain amino acid transport system ATP-binding protein